MKPFMFGKLIAGFVLVVVLGKIYQHNRIIQARYEKQRLEVMHHRLLKEQNALTIKLAELTNYQTVKTFAHDTLHMEPLSLTRVITFTGV